jgi:hypothetical protein
VDFVEEVEERLRADRYRDLANRYLPWVIAALVAAVIGWLGVWGYGAWRDRNIGQASIAYDKAMVALAGGDPTGAYNGFAPIARNGPAAYRTLALMQQANIRLGAGKGDEAVALYDAAAKAAPNAIFGDLARLRAAQVLMDTAPYAVIETRLKALIGADRPFSLPAREMLAMAKLEAGKTQEARGDFNALGLTLGVTPGMRGRAQGAIALIDSGQANLVAQVVKTAATLPPSAGAMSPGPGQAPSSTPGPDADQTPAPDAAPDAAPTPPGNAQ